MISEVRPLFSSSWYHAQGISPRLKKNALIHRHVYRGDIWYVVEDDIGSRYHRLSPVAYWFVSQMDGINSIAHIWERAMIKFGDEAPTQQEVIQLLGQLHSSDLLLCNVTPDLAELFQRYETQKKGKIRQRLTSPMSIKFALIDPDRFLNATYRWVKPVFSFWGLALWCSLLIFVISLALQNWGEFTENISDRVLTPGNLILIAILFPIIKALHELGHAYAAKVWGGEIHEIGIMFLVFMPVPYVDASSSSAFSKKYQRVVVGLAGMMVELAIAAISFLLWLNIDGGLYKSLAYNIVLISGVSTLFFNANPLLRFDGYYVLADLLEIPNLYQRSHTYFTYLIKNYFLGLVGEKSPVQAKGEVRWFLIYGVLSYAYRFFIVFAIAIFISTKFFIFGVLLGLWSIFSLFGLPVVKAVQFLLRDSRVRQKTYTSYVKVGTLGLVLSALIGWVPIPYWTNAKGIVWLSDNATVRAGTDCFVDEMYVERGGVVDKSQPLMHCIDDFIESELQVKTAQLEERKIRFHQARRDSPLEFELNRKALSSAEAELLRAQERQEQQLLISPGRGYFEFSLGRDIEQKYFSKGDVVGYVIPQHTRTIRAVIEQKDAGRVRLNTKRIELRRMSKPAEVLSGSINRELPGADFRLPASALSSVSGSDIAVDLSDPEKLKTFSRIFQFDIELDHAIKNNYIMERVQIRFRHDDQTLWQRVSDVVSLTLMEHFGV